MLICCNLSKIFDSTIRGRHPYLPAQRTALPQHFSKRGLSIEAATLHRLPHASLRLGGCSFHISRWMEKLNISVTILERINKRCYVLTKLSAKSHWRGTRRVFSLKYTFDLLGGGGGGCCLGRKPDEPNPTVLGKNIIHQPTGHRHHQVSITVRIVSRNTHTLPQGLQHSVR